jgi:hypothetical protein
VSAVVDHAGEHVSRQQGTVIAPCCEGRRDRSGLELIVAVVLTAALSACGGSASGGASSPSASSAASVSALAGTVGGKPVGFDLPVACQYESGPVGSGQRVLWQVRCTPDPNRESLSLLFGTLQAQGWTACGSGAAADGRSWQKSDWVITLTANAGTSSEVGLMLSPRRIVSC